MYSNAVDLSAYLSFLFLFYPKSLLIQKISLNFKTLAGIGGKEKRRKEYNIVILETLPKSFTTMIESPPGLTMNSICTDYLYNSPKQKL